MSRRKKDSVLPPLLLLVAGGFLGSCKPKTAAPPDRFLQAPITVAVETTAEGRALLDEFVQYARLFGCPVVDPGDRSDYTISGTIAITEDEPTTLPAGPVQRSRLVNANIRIVETSTGAGVEEFPPIKDRRFSGFTAEKALDAARRKGAWELARLVFYFGKTLGQPDVQYCSAGLLIETDTPYFYNDVVQELLAMGPRAVPYLLCQMRDLRGVELKGSLPRLDPDNPGRVRVCDVANYALEQFFKLESRLPVGASSSEINRHMHAWQREWTKRCAGYLVGEELTEFLAAHRARAAGGAKPAVAPRTADAPRTDTSPSTDQPDTTGQTP